MLLLLFRQAGRERTSDGGKGHGNRLTAHDVWLYAQDAGRNSIYTVVGLLGGGGPRRKLSDGRLSVGKARNLGFHSVRNCRVAPQWLIHGHINTYTGARGEVEEYVLDYSLGASNRPTLSQISAVVRVKDHDSAGAGGGGGL
jgi:hypothetical protein